MKRYSLLVLILAFAVACKKDKDSLPDTPAITTQPCLLTEKKDSATGKEKVTYEYDDGFRLIKQTYSVQDVIGEHEEYLTVQYSANSVTSQRFGSYKFSPPVTFLLNGDGNVTGAIVARPDTVFGVAGFLNDTTTFTYSADKKLVESRHSATVLKNGTNEVLSRSHNYSTFTYSGGRLSKWVNDQDLTNTSGSGANIYVYEYFYDETTPTVKFNPAQGYFTSPIAQGALMSDKIPVKITSTINGSNTWNSEYTATINDLGFPTKIRCVQKGPSGPPYFVSATLYTYNCP